MSWHDNAPCKGHTQAFFGLTARDKRTARNLCASCPYIEPCREEALELTARHQLIGYWAGMTQQQREAIAGRKGMSWGYEDPTLYRRKTAGYTENNEKPERIPPQRDTPAKTQ